MEGQPKSGPSECQEKAFLAAYGVFGVVFFIGGRIVHMRGAQLNVVADHVNDELQQPIVSHKRFKLLVCGDDIAHLKCFVFAEVTLVAILRVEGVDQIE